MAYDVHFTFSGVVGRHRSVSACPLYPHLAHPHALTRISALSTGTPRQAARTILSTDTSFLSFTRPRSSPVRDTTFPLSEAVLLDAYPTPLLFSFSLYRVDSVYDHPPDGRGIGSRDKQEFWVCDLTVNYQADFRSAKCLHVLPIFNVVALRKQSFTPHSSSLNTALYTTINDRSLLLAIQLPILADVRVRIQFGARGHGCLHLVEWDRRSGDRLGP